MMKNKPVDNLRTLPSANASFIQPDSNVQPVALEDLVEKGFEVYELESLIKFNRAAQDTGDQATIEKAKKDLSKLTRTQVIDKKGVQRTVWIKTGEQVNDKEVVRKQTETEQTVQSIIDGNMSKSDKARALLDLGVTDKKQIAALTGNHYSRVHQLYKQWQAKGGQANTENAVQAENSIAEQTQDPALKLGVDERWDAYDMFLDMVAGGMSKSCIAFGTGGVGKTYTMKQVMKRHNAVEYDPFEGQGDINVPDSYDYVKITGKSTPTAMFKALYEHNGKTIVFDDCDSVLQDETSVNIFKGALDTSGDGTVVYDSGRDIKTAKEGYYNVKEQSIVPKRFKFNGRVIFISNLTPEQMPQPLVDSRSLAIDLSMSRDETIERLRAIIDFMPIEDTDGREIPVSTEAKHAAVDFLDQYKDRIREGKLNARTIGNIVKIQAQATAMGRDWKKMALAILAN